LSVRKISVMLNPPTRLADPTCRTPRAAPTLFCSSFKKRACCGESGRKKKTSGAMAMVGRPSTRNRILQLSIRWWPDVMPYASAPANVLPRG
jgi:hypothetical protein